MVSKTQSTRSHAESMEIVLSLSRKMLESAESEDWQQVIVLENDRRNLIDSLDFSEADQEAYEGLVPMFDEVLKINKQLTELGGQELQRCADQIKGLSRSQKAAKLYKQL